MEILSAGFFNDTPDSMDNSSDPHWGGPFSKTLTLLDEGLYQEFYGLWVFLMVANTLMFVVGIVLNSLALYVFCLGTRSRTAPVVYTINLAVADLLVALSLPARIALYHSGGRCEACSHVHTFSYFVNMYCSILLLTSICVDRYMAVVRAAGASRRWRSPGVAKGVSVAVWLFAVVVTYSFQTTALGFHGAACHRLTVLFALTVLEFVLPLLVIAAFTVRVACALADRRLMPQSWGRRARAVRLLVAVLVVFAVCFTPFHVRQAVVFFRLGGSRAQHVVAYHATVTLSSLNSCLDPVVYCFVPDSFRSAFRRACCRRRAEPQCCSGGEGASAHRSSKGSSTAMAIVHSVATVTLTPCTLPLRDLPERPSLP